MTKESGKIEESKEIEEIEEIKEIKEIEESKEIEEIKEIEESKEVEESSKSWIQVLTGKLRSACKCMISKKNIKTLEIVVFSILQYVFLPVLCGFLTAGILAIAGIEKLGLDRFGFTKYPTIKMQAVTYSTYSGLALAAGVGCALGLILSRILKFGARLGHFDFISPPRSLDAMSIPSVRGFIISIIRLLGVPMIVILAALTSVELAKTGVLPAVRIDKKYEIFEITLAGMVTVATLGCLLMFVYDMMLTVLLRMTKRKEAEVKEIK